MKAMLVQSENTHEDNQAAIEIDREMNHGTSNKIVWYSALGKDVAALKEQSAFLVWELKRLTEKMASYQKRIDRLDKEVQRLNEEIVKINKNVPK